MSYKLSSVVVIYDDGIIKLASGTTAERPSTTVEGMIRFNNELDHLEYYNGSSWTSIDQNMYNIIAL